MLEVAARRKAMAVSLACDPFRAQAVGWWGGVYRRKKNKTSISFLILYKSVKMYRMGITMPAKAPPIGDLLGTRLKALGERIRAHRESQKVSATVAAEAAGMSRVTLHRIERGEPSVTMGAYLSAIDALGLQLELRDPNAPKVPAGVAGLPDRVRLADFPQLKRLAWQLKGVDELSPADALNLYERNWRHIDTASLEPAERSLVQALADQLGGGRLLV
jgi:transcriptional regulator with XRE-family HTH domain